ncbi:MAG: small ribosomal subunit Rsm22 family protein [Bryobacteraceae bacterium]|nr:small ribosomal subunit Rsm22 family protein [Bryobacteraceae bacterium]MDW8378288.1 small ribosomal subunit Rsm22 family protein [Bryobacterales bacterium]
MKLPTWLRDKLESLLSDASPAELGRAVEVLSQHYRQHKPTQTAALAPGLRAKAYLATRFAATFAAIRNVLQHVPSEPPPTSVLDLGAGPGTASLAALETFPHISRITLFERDADFRTLGSEFLPHADWRNDDFTQVRLPPHDLVIAAWSLGETPNPLDAALEAWRAALQALVILAPGTPAAFAEVRQIRKRLIEAGAYLAAPCPAAGECPMPAGDWCHFRQRVERSSLHRRAKKGALPYEDEKFSYLVFCRYPVPRPAGRIVRHPQHRPDNIKLTVCLGDRITEIHVTRRSRELWRAARQADWGEAWNTSTLLPPEASVSSPDR